MEIVALSKGGARTRFYWFLVYIQKARNTHNAAVALNGKWKENRVFTSNVFVFRSFFLLRMLVANNNRMPLQTKNPQENRKIFTVREIRLSFFNTLRSIYLHYGTNILAFNWLDQIFLSPKNGFTFQNKKKLFRLCTKSNENHLSSNE